MKIAWCFASGTQIDPAIEIEQIKKIGSSWGSWNTWRGCETENIVCYDLQKAVELNKRALQAVTNLYVPENFYQKMNQPVGFKYYSGEFNENVDNIEDIVSMHLAASSGNPVVLLLGYKFKISGVTDNPLALHKQKNYHGMLRSVLNEYKDVQWVAVDIAEDDLDNAYSELTNFTCDTMETVLNLL